MLHQLYRPVLLALIGLVLVVGAPERQAYAYPPAGTDDVEVWAQISLTSRLGQETISFAGTASISRSDPYDDGGLQVVDLEIKSLLLGGESVTGSVVITQSSTNQSLGQIRSDQPGEDWPASAHLDVFVDVIAPASPGDTLSKHNNVAIHAVPMYSGEELAISSWPPTAVPWEAAPSPCVPLLPTLPKDVCVTALSMTVSATGAGGGVGGHSELSGVLTAQSDGPNARLLLVISSLGAVIVAGGMLLIRRRLTS
jgi:hypothetical protein